MAFDGFFQERGEQSEVKAHIVQKYFHVWAQVMIPSARSRGQKLAYVDLFCGPGRYEDGTPSTPLLVLEQAIEDSNLCNMLVTVFNDVNSEYVEALRQEIDALNGIDKLAHCPKLQNVEVGAELAALFEKIRFVPTLFFVDPCGYRGVSLKLINAVLKNWGCECIFFFNYNRVNAAINNELVKEHMEALFGRERAAALDAELQGKSPDERELTIVEAISQALVEGEGKFVLPFRFRTSRGTRTSHHLIFVTKHHKGYEIMKDIMAKESSTTEQGVPTFEYNPASAHYPLLFDLSRPLDDLPIMLLNEFAGQRLKMVEVYRRHNVGRRFLKRNYKEVLRLLEEQGRIQAIPPREERPKNTFADHVKVTFPER